MRLTVWVVGVLSTKEIERKPEITLLSASVARSLSTNFFKETLHAYNLSCIISPQALSTV